MMGSVKVPGTMGSTIGLHTKFSISQPSVSFPSNKSFLVEFELFDIFMTLNLKYIH